EQHGGVIDYISSLGEGTTFFVELDLLDVPDLDL
ncbi:MAG: HAMP domain-containing histidine kinase, partial [Marinibacterium sp.]|nr:HAMP domain-containing histidine kinase [Marinibacterium sp.]